MDAHATGSDGPSPSGFTLVEQWGTTTWLGRTAEGALVACERVTMPPEAEAVDRQSFRRRAAEVLATRHAALVPVRRVVRRGSNLWLLSDVDDGVSLHRLLDRGKPSLTEAASLAALVLEAVAALHEAGCTHAGLDSRSVRIGPAGDVRLTGWGSNALFPAGLDDETRRADVRAAAGIVGEIARSAGRPARALTEQEDKLVARLASAADPRSLVRRGPLKAARSLDLVVGPPARRRACRQRLAILGQAVAAADAPDSTRDIVTEGATPATATAATAAGQAPLQRSLPPPARRPPIWPRIWKGAAIGAVVALLFGAEVRFFGHRVQDNVHVLLSGDVHGAAAVGPRRPAPLPVLGPASAGPINHLELRPLDGCRAGAVCTAVVQVTVAPQDRPLDVAFGLEVVDRCRSRHEPRPGGVLSIPPGRDRAVQTVALPLPDGRSLAVIPLSSSPVTVAGTPMRLSPDDGPC